MSRSYTYVCESISSFVGYLKGRSALIIFERHANLKYKYGNRAFWCRGYYVTTVGNRKEAVYICTKSIKRRYDVRTNDNKRV